ncbi:plasmalemma vesicle associated protein a [Pagrus major]|uniref:plasmalemma vesicle associated protein a n=1 Tax=Pagrus major TaxID=143350 RepID=UPI003CC8AEF7
MYSSSYSQVSKYSPQAQKKMQYRSKGKSCGYYMRIVFFFSSLIQSLIIVSLVLFLIYGKKQDTASTSRIQDLEESFSRLSIENVALRHQRKNLTTLLNSTLTEKARNDWDLARLRHLSNISLAVIQDFDKKLQQCNRELFLCRATPPSPGGCQPILGPCNCGLSFEQLRARLELVQSNFTQTVQRMRMEMDQIAKERDNLNLEAIRLRRDKSTHQKEVQILRQRCKDDFVQSLSGVSNVTKAFLEKIDSLFPNHIPFQLTCTKQREHLEQIRTNCTSLSREVEDKYQRYLNNVGDQVSGIQGENSRLKAENWRLSEDYRWCSQNRTDLIKDNKQNLEKLQSKHDMEKERLLMDKMRLHGDIQVLENNVNYKNKEVEHIREQLKQLNMTCMTKAGFGGFQGGLTSRGSTIQNGWGTFGGGGSSSASSSSSNVGQLSRTGSVPSFGSSGTGSSSSLFPSRSASSTGSGLNKLGSTGTGSSSSSLFPSGSSSSTGSVLNRGTGSSSSSLLPSGSSSSTGSVLNRGTGSSSSSLFSSGSSSSIGSGLNKIGSTGGSSGSTGLNPSLSSAGRGSSTSGSSSGSTGSSSSFGLSSNFGSSLNKPTTNVKSSPGLGSSSGSTGSTNKSGSSSSAFSSWLGLGNSNSGQSKTGSGTGKGTSNGNSFGGTGSSTGTGRTSGLVGGSVSVAQHVQDLQRIINPAGPEEKQDLSRMLG